MDTICRKPVLYLLKTEPFQDPAVFAKYLSLLPETRRRTVEKYKPEEVRHMSLAASVLLLHVLREAGLSDAKMRFTENSFGKPFLENNPFFFNLSHSKGAAVCAASPGIIGCDIEALRPAVLAIAKLHFCPEEYERLLRISDPAEQNRAFCRLWTLKESVVKALGGGLTIPLTRFCISPDTDETTVRTNAQTQKLYYKEYDTCDGFFVSCSAFSRADLPEHLHQLNLSDLNCQTEDRG